MLTIAKSCVRATHWGSPANTSLLRPLWTRANWISPIARGARRIDRGARNFLASGYRGITVVPMLRGDTAIGAISIVRRQPGALTEKQRQLLRTFASQAVIAIENTRLFHELRARTDDLGRSVGELRALGEVSQAVNSTLDLQTVLSTIVAKAVQLSDTEAGAITSSTRRSANFTCVPHTAWMRK